jgi:UDP-N-acetylmuramyl pentapeptide synthase
MKEWRMDRLIEHLQREGWIANLLGSVRMGLVVFFAIAASALTGYLVWRFGGTTLNTLGEIPTGDSSIAVIVAVFSIGIGTYAVLLFLWLAALALLSVAQLLLPSRRLPVWTSKTILVFMLCLVIDATLAFLWPMILFLLPIVQPLVVLIAWIILLPLDLFLKGLVMKKAETLRRSLESPTVIGIVGSVGKTTTKELLHHLLQDLHPITTPEHVNTEMGVAQWMLRTVQPRTEHPLLIVEMGAYRQGEIATLCRIAKPTIGIVTPLGSDHLALFGSEEAIVEANAELLPSLPKDGHLFLAGDNDAARRLAKRSSCPATVAGIDAASDVRATDIHEAESGNAFMIDDQSFRLSMHGKHNVANALLAIAVAKHLGITDARIRELLGKFRTMPHTFHLKIERGVTILDDTYNVSPLSFRAAIDWAAKRPERPRVLLTSGLLETGADEQRFLQELGAASAKTFTRVIFTTNRGRSDFAKGFGGEVELLRAGSAPVKDESLLICVGRMPLHSIRTLLP